MFCDTELLRLFKMKHTAFVFITLMVGTLANPVNPDIFGEGSAQEVSNNERIIVDQVIKAVENLKQQIRDAGLDPYNLDASANYELPVPVLFSAKAIVEALEFKGLSNIVVKSVIFYLLQSRLTFDIYLPDVSLSIGKAEAAAIVFGDLYDGAASGIVNINSIRIIGDAHVHIGISGISVRSLALQFSLGGIQSNLNINLLGKDLSSKINTLLSTILPGKVAVFTREINQLLEIIAWRIINDSSNPNLF